MRKTKIRKNIDEKSQRGTDRSLKRAEEGPKVLHVPPTAHMVHSISSPAVAVDTLGGYNRRHHSDFSISTFNLPQCVNIISKFEKKNYSIFLALRVVWEASRWKLKNRHDGAISIHLRCQPPLQVRKLNEPCEL